MSEVENREHAPKQVIVMRKDLNMRKGKMIAQGAHASMKVFFDRGKVLYCYDSAKDERWWKLLIEPIQESETLWINVKFTKIVVGVENEEELFAVFNKAKEMGILCAMVQDAGLTEFKEPTYTCCAIGPDDVSKIDAITGDLQLL